MSGQSPSDISSTLPVAAEDLVKENPPLVPQVKEEEDPFAPASNQPLEKDRLTNISNKTIEELVGLTEKIKMNTDNLYDWTKSNGRYASDTTNTTNNSQVSTTSDTYWFGFRQDTVDKSFNSTSGLLLKSEMSAVPVMDEKITKSGYFKYRKNLSIWSRNINTSIGEQDILKLIKQKSFEKNEEAMRIGHNSSTLAELIAKLNLRFTSGEEDEVSNGLTKLFNTLRSEGTYVRKFTSDYETEVNNLRTTGLVVGDNVLIFTLRKLLDLPSELNPTLFHIAITDTTLRDFIVEVNRNFGSVTTTATQQKKRQRALYYTPTPVVPNPHQVNRPCNYGLHCWFYLTNGTCRFVHTEEERTAMDNIRNGKGGVNGGKGTGKGGKGGKGGE